MKFLKLTTPDGRAIYIAKEHIIRVRGANRDNIKNAQAIVDLVSGDRQTVAETVDYVIDQLEN